MDEPIVSPPASRKRIIWLSAGVLLLCLLVAGGIFGYQRYTKHQLAQDYTEHFAQLQDKAKSFSNQVNSAPSNDQSFLELVDHYQKLDKENTFEDQLKDLNNNPKYSNVKNKMSVDALMITKSTNELKKILGDIDSIQVILQKNSVLDDDIKVMENSTSTTIGDYDSKVSELMYKNDMIRDDLAGTLVHNDLKHAHNQFLEAITYRGKYLTESKAANNAHLDAVNAGEESNRQNRLAQQYQSQGNSSYYFSSTYYNLSNEAYQQASDKNETVSMKLKQQDSHKQEAARMLAKYTELIGFTKGSRSQTNTLVNSTKGQQSNNNTVTTTDHSVEQVPDHKLKEVLLAYMNSAVRATSTYDFSKMEPYLNPNGKAYKEAKDYLNYLKGKAIYEELPSSEVTSIQRLPDARFQLSTRETYDIYYKDGSMKTKSFTSQFILVNTNDGVKVDQLLSTNEIK